MHQLVIQFPLHNTYPDTANLDALFALEDTLEQDANGAYMVDGHDAGAAEMDIFILTNDAISTLDLIKSKLPDRVNWRACFRELDSDEYTSLASDKPRSRF